jgi:3-hydroxybutyryl-CoA dehydrogenase
VGLDVISYVHDELGEPYYTPPRLLKELVRAGRLGRKTGGGFYKYPEENPEGVRVVAVSARVRS